MQGGQTYTPVLRRIALKRLVPDVLIATALLVSGFVVGRSYDEHFMRSGGQPQFYQRRLDAAVMYTCGRGFVAVQRPADAPRLDAFLRQQQSALNCSDIPEQIATEPPDVYQRVSRYLLYSVSALWSSRGITWEALSPLFGVLFGASAVAAYGLFRVGMNRWLGCLVALAFMSSSAQFNNLPHLRDYAKAPFAIAVIALSGWIASRSHTARGLVVLSAAAGAVLGIGSGFRTDLLLLTVAVPVAILLAPTDRRPGVRGKGLALGVFAIVFVATAWPILRAYAGGNNIWHVIVLGLMSSFDEPLGIEPAFYSLGQLYHDEYVSLMINSYSQRVLGNPDVLPLASKAYETASAAYFREVLATMPADVVVRTFASVLNILKLPFDTPAAPPDLVSSDFISRVYRVRAELLTPLAPLAPALAFGALAIVSAVNIRIALFWLFAAAFFAGMPALQFHGRHFFHLEVLGWLAAGFLVSQLVAAASRWSSRARASGRPAPRLRVMQTAAFLTACGLIVFGGLAALRIFQRSRVERLVRTVLSAPVQPLSAASSDQGWITVDARTLPDSTSPAEQDRPRIRTTYVTAVVAPDCPYETIPFVLRYNPSGFADLSTSITVRLPETSGTGARVFLPIYEQLGQATPPRPTILEHFQIRAPAECIAGIWRVIPGEQLPILPLLTIREDWRSAPAFQSIRTDDHQEKLYVAARSPTPRGLRQQPLVAALTAPVYRAAIADRDGEKWTVRGAADRGFTYLLRGPEEFKRQGTRLVARGRLMKGGFTLGLLFGGRWSSRVDVTESGPFRIVLDVPIDGAYEIVLANYLPGALSTSFQLDEIGWTPEPVR